MRGTARMPLIDLPACVRSADAPRSSGTVALGTTAQGLAQWREHLRAELGVDPTLEDHRLSLSLYFRDPDDNPYEITTYEHQAARALLVA